MSMIERRWQSHTLFAAESLTLLVRLRRRQDFERIHFRVVHDQAPVQVRPSDAACGADTSDQRAGGNIVALLDVDRRQVKVQRIEAQPVVNHDGIARKVERLGKRDTAALSGVDWRPRCGGNIEAAVRCARHSVQHPARTKIAAPARPGQRKPKRSRPQSLGRRLFVNGVHPLAFFFDSRGFVRRRLNKLWRHAKFLHAVMPGSNGERRRAREGFAARELPFDVKLPCTRLRFNADSCVGAKMCFRRSVSPEKDLVARQVPPHVREVGTAANTDAQERAWDWLGCVKRDFDACIAFLLRRTLCENGPDQTDRQRKNNKVESLRPLRMTAASTPLAAKREHRGKLHQNGCATEAQTHLDVEPVPVGMSAQPSSAPPAPSGSSMEYLVRDFSACCSSASSISRLISSVYGTPLASHIFGYMLMLVKPGIVLISFK